ncbi:hypothetical protein KQH42_21130 [Streptomyces sp. CHA1]|nr:hypothetical protein [Streptomyces sp. G11C]MCO6702840.1 hypothetical protein [Streptomyces sp. CHB9.2]MCO6709278.1 hypothetical protein [Streptomyces sp. CHA3]MCO6715020.1 hypothetical protein [Streptomyces sp. CHB19.2]MCO6721144.1 hypothetical protein [Streptomyces sp. Vc714c-19]MCO6727032.1 hypothetical protein [Streptomyces sp. CHA16]MCO6732864.1 hypothetical protein [Streptomyces sp. EL9]MCO6738729.1 hypothetical protein [Streptomyces sp. CHA15]MCO6744763.1 hypothetical protein [Str
MRRPGKAASLATPPVVVVASGLSPSGPIHLGDLREVMTPQVQGPAQELKHQRQKQRKPVDGAEEDEGSSGAGGYYPYKPYCVGCGKDFTTLTSYADETTEMAYTCTVESCCFSESRS